MMPSATPTLPTSRLDLPHNRDLAQLMTSVEQARRSPDDFARVCFADPSGRPLCQAAVSVENGCCRQKGGRGGPVDAAQQGLLDEMTTFPVAEHDDLLDAAMSGTAYLLDRPEPRVW